MRHFVPRLLCLLALLLCLPVDRSGNVGDDIDANELLPEDLRSVIMLDNSIFSKHTRDIGFNYDLIDMFGEEYGLDIKVDSRPESDECWRKLLDGYYSFIVFDSTTAVPEMFADSVMVGITGKSKNLWAVSGDNDYLINYVNDFLSKMGDKSKYRELLYRHYRTYCIAPSLDSNLHVSALSPYDDIVKKYSGMAGIDWRLLSAIIYQESRFNMATTSSHNAKGLMQILESTAAHFGVADVLDPDSNVKAGTLYFNHLLKEYRGDGMDELNAIKFALGAYNAGNGRIAECRKMADSLGLDRNQWEDVAAAFDSVPGFSGRNQTRQYVINVLGSYDNYKRLIE